MQTYDLTQIINEKNKFEPNGTHRFKNLYDGFSKQKQIAA